MAEYHANFSRTGFETYTQVVQVLVENIMFEKCS